MLLSFQAQLESVSRDSLKQAAVRHCAACKDCHVAGWVSRLRIAQAEPLLEHFEISVGLGNVSAESDILAMVSQEAGLTAELQANCQKPRVSK